jgi:hypothetical protein
MSTSNIRDKYAAISDGWVSWMGREIGREVVAGHKASYPTGIVFVTIKRAVEDKVGNCLDKLEHMC